MKKLISLAVCAALICLVTAGFVFAQAEKKAAAEVTVTGTVEKTDAGLTIKTDKETLKVDGAAVTAEMAGKTVKVTGTVEGDVIKVTKAEEVKAEK